MRARQWTSLLMTVGLLSLAACGSDDETSAGSADDDPVTLQLAVADEETSPSAPYVQAFIDQVDELSDGSVTVEPTYEAGADTPEGFEAGVIRLVTTGDADLALAGSRAFDLEGMTSFQALQSPFLITNDDLAEAVATGEVGTQMLDSLSDDGVVGLTLWPEDLRHPFSVVEGAALVSPDDFAGLTIRTPPSDVSEQLVEALGGTPAYESGGYQGAESGLQNGSNLTGRPTATGNVVFYPKFEALIANDTAFGDLSEVQQSAVRGAAAAAQGAAIAEHQSEAEAAAAWCADGGTIVLASAAQIDEFETAAQPVFDQIVQDSLNADP